MYPTSSRRGHRPKTQVTNPFQRASSHRSHLGLLKRMDITGARWGLEGAEAVLKLRALIATGDFDAYWRFHFRREHERIHHAKYRDTYILAA
jgi:hypothetical protein